MRYAGRVDPPVPSDVNGAAIWALESSPPVMRKLFPDELFAEEDMPMAAKSPAVQQEVGDAVESNGTSHFTPANVAEIGDDVDMQEGDRTVQHDLDFNDVVNVSSDDDGTELDSGQYQLGFYITNSTASRLSLRRDCHYEHRDGPWRERRREYGTYMSVRAATANHVGAAQDSMIQRVRPLVKAQKCSVIRSSKFLKKTYLTRESSRS